MTFDIVKVLNESRELEEHSDSDRLSKEAVSFVGQLKKNETDPSKVFLRSERFANQSILLEFNLRDVVFAEDLKTITRDDGAAIRIVKIWLRKGAIGVKLEPFSVADFSEFFKKRFEL